MPLKEISLKKGVYLDVDPLELANPDYAAKLTNLMLAKSGANVDRPDLVQFGTTGQAFGIQGLAVFKTFSVAVSKDRRIYQIDVTGAVTDITGASPLAGTSRPVFDSDGTYLAIAGGDIPKVWDGVNPCTDMPGAPPPMTHISYLDGYWLSFNEDSNVIQWAGPTAPTRAVWGAGNYFSKEGLPDNIVAQKVLLREFYAIGTDSMETFQNFGDSSVPFGRTFFIDRGISAPYSVVQADNTLFFLDSERHFVRLEARTPIFISNELDAVLKDPAFIVGDCFGMKIEIDGFYLIAWVFPTQKRAFVYDFALKEWAEWNSFVDGNEGMVPINCHCYVQGWGKHLVGDPNTGIIYQLTRKAKGTAVQPLRRVRRTGHYDFGIGARKRSNYYLFHVLRGTGTPGDTEPFFEVRVNDDNGGWTDPVQVGLGYPGDPQAPIRVQLRGIYRKRQLEISTTAAVDFRIIKVEENIEVMES
jgi:hypothetical protein